MFTYLILNILFLLAAYGVLCIAKMGKVTKIVFFTTSILLVFTALFDSLIVGTDIVRYNESKIVGLYIGAAPIEDFFYALLAGILIPAIWRLLERHYERKV